MPTIDEGLPPLEDVLAQYPEGAVQEFMNSFTGGRPPMTPAEAASSAYSGGAPDALRQLMMANQGLDPRRESVDYLSRWYSPLGQAQGLKDLYQGGANDPSRYAYGPTKAGPFVFFPSQPPQQQSGFKDPYVQSMLLSGLTNAFNQYMGKRKQGPMGGGTAGG